MQVLLTIVTVIVTFGFLGLVEANSSLPPDEDSFNFQDGVRNKKNRILTHNNVFKHQEDILRQELRQARPFQKKPVLQANWPILDTYPKPAVNHQELNPNGFNSFYDYSNEDTVRPNRHRISEYYGELILDIKLEYCKQNATCENITYPTCLGTKLPYTSTTLELTDLKTQKQVQQRLLLYENLRHVPKCWAVIQPFLCSLYLPKCENGQVDLPSLDMCNITRGPCKILHDTFFFPPLLRCENNRDMPLPNACKNDLKEIKFNTTGECLKPLIYTDSQLSFYPGVDSCGLQCNDPLFIEEEHESMYNFVAWCAGICSLFTIFTIATYVLEWKSAKHYPGVVIFYIHVCFLGICLGWLMQFYGGNTRHDIVCRKDHTARVSEPSPEENLTCVIVFVLIYYFLIASLVWFVILTYTLHLTFEAMGIIYERKNMIAKKNAYFQLASWSLALILTIIALAFAQIDGDSLSGICFISRVNVAARAFFLLLPVVVAMLAGLYFLIRGLLNLINAKKGSKDIISPRFHRKIRFGIIRMSFFTLAIVLIGVCTLYCHYYYFKNATLWRDGLQEHILCRLVHSNPSKYCPQPEKPDIRLIKLQIFCLFFFGIAISSWIWTPSTKNVWVRSLRRKFDGDKDEPIKPPKHKMIAQVFAKRKTLFDGDAYSFNYQQHTDPVGLNFDMNSGTPSNDLSTTWASALPKFVRRRCAVPEIGCVCGIKVPKHLAENHAGCSTSMDSEVSISLCHVYVASRRNSGDSQLSVQVSELKAMRRKVVRDDKRTSRRMRTRKRHNNRTRSRASNNHLSISRKESSTSMESQLGTHILAALGLDLNRHNDQKLEPNRKRRTANAGLDTILLSDLLQNDKLKSEEENEEEKSEQNSLLGMELENGNISDSQSQSSDESDDAELKRLVAVQSSLNSGVSVGTQHKCKSVDVGVQTDSKSIQTSS